MTLDFQPKDVVNTMSTDLILQSAVRTTKAALVVACFALIAANAALAQVYSASLEELATTSSAVVVGKTTNIRSFWNADRTQIMTEVTLQVDDQVAGNTGPETIVTIPGGRVGNSLYEVSDMPIFIEGEEVIVFLWQDPEGRNLVTGGAQGRIGIEVDQALNQRVVTSALPTVTPGQSAANARDPQAVGAPEEKVLVTQIIKRIRDARER